MKLPFVTRKTHEEKIQENWDAGFGDGYAAGFAEGAKDQRAKANRMIAKLAGDNAQLVRANAILNKELNNAKRDRRKR